MQALQMSGQTAEFRDPLPVRGPESGELDTAEHPFMKLLAKLRDAMKQGEGPDQSDHNGESKFSRQSFSKAETLSKSAGVNGSGLEGSDTGFTGSSGLLRNADSISRNGLSKASGERGQELSPASRESSQRHFKGKDLSSFAGSKPGSKPGADESAEAGPGTEVGKDSRAKVNTALTQGVATKDQKKPGQGDTEQEVAALRSSDSAPEALAKRRAMAAKDSINDATMVASGNGSGAINLASLPRNQNPNATNDKNSSSLPGDDVKNSGRRSSRYSVVDMRLKASIGKAAPDTPADGKLEGRTPGSNASDLNRSGFSGTDAAGRPIGNDQPGGFSELAKGLGSEGSDKAPASFADNLAARLRDGGALDIVRSAQIVLKDGDAGLIRLRLEPESLGGVKIELKMADKQISARIIVESDLAGEAFRSSLDSLRDAFASSGFETTSIEVEVRDGRAGSGDAGRGDTPNDGDQESQGLYAARKVEELGDAVPSAEAAYGRYGVIDLVV